jgi:hypothetical protein
VQTKTLAQGCAVMIGNSEAQGSNAAVLKLSHGKPVRRKMRKSENPSKVIIPPPLKENSSLGEPFHFFKRHLLPSQG